MRVMAWFWAALIVCGWVHTSYSLEFRYSVFDVSDVTVGEDLWRYSYDVSGVGFSAFEGFSVRFDPLLYGSLEDPPSAVNGDWFAFVDQPNAGLGADGVYTAQALVDGASLADLFTVTFVWLGAGLPGAQPYEVFDDGFGIIEEGTTSAAAAGTPGGTPGIAEPWPVVLFGLGLAALMARPRRVGLSA